MSDATNDVHAFREAAARASAEELSDGMCVGLGSGDTARLAVAAIGERVRKGLKIIGIPTSDLTAEQARGLSIPLSDLGTYPVLDVTIDGADEVGVETLDLIKGGGGNLLREKIVASASKRLIIVVDEHKLVHRLGERFKVPVEVDRFGWQSTEERLKRLDCVPVLRMEKGEPYLTDGGHYILDCAFGIIENPAALGSKLDGVVGVIEHGLFIGMTNDVFVGGAAGARRLRKSE